MRDQSTPISGPPAGRAAILPLSVRGLRFSVPGRDLIADVDLDFVAGRRTVIMGANGAGKSLLLRLLHGLLPPSAGAILWAGRPADAAVRAAQAMVFQRPVLLRRSVAANLDYGLAHAGIGRAERRERVGAMLAAARLTPLAGVPARLLSAGEQQRLSIARALALAPSLLFLDEPTAGLDPASTLAVESLIDRAADAGIRIVLVTHDRGQAERHGDEIVFLHQGRVAEATPAERFFTRPDSEPARAYLAGRIFL